MTAFVPLWPVWMGSYTIWSHECPRGVSKVYAECTGGNYCQRTPTMDGFSWLLFWIFDYSFWLFDYSFRLFDYNAKYSKFLVEVETWFLLLKTIFMTPNKVLNITNNQMFISNIWIFRTNNRSNNQIFISIILIIRPRLAFVCSNNDLCIPYIDELLFLVILFRTTSITWGKCYRGYTRKA